MRKKSPSSNLTFSIAHKIVLFNVNSCLSHFHSRIVCQCGGDIAPSHSFIHSIWRILFRSHLAVAFVSLSVTCPSALNSDCTTYLRRRCWKYRVHDYKSRRTLFCEMRRCTVYVIFEANKNSIEKSNIFRIYIIVLVSSSKNHIF